MESNMVGWFEIPVEDMDRAKIFYEAVFQVKIQVQELGDTRMGWFPFKNGQPGRILKPKTLISPNVGYMGLFMDSEGNRIALLSKK